MKSSREFLISNKVITSADLRRIGSIVDKQGSLATKSGHHFSLEYTVKFADRTTINSDSNDAFDDETLTAFPARPIEVSIAFYNYSLKRSISISLAHGDSPIYNRVSISAIESAWLADTFDALKRCIDGLRPQELWVRRYRTPLLFLCAVSYTCLIGLFVQGLGFAVISSISPQKLSALRSDGPPVFLRLIAATPDWVIALPNAVVGFLFIGPTILDRLCSL